MTYETALILYFLSSVSAECLGHYGTSHWLSRTSRLIRDRQGVEHQSAQHFLSFPFGELENVRSELRWLYFETVNPYGDGFLNEIH